MPVYNSEKYIAEVIRGVLGQTFSDFEFIIINDGSTDKSLEIIQSYSDQRIKVINNEINIGNYPSRNRGLQMVLGKYICMINADDILLPHKLERQFEFMEKETKVGMAGSALRLVISQEDIYYESDDEVLKIRLLKDNCLEHSSVIIRRDCLLKYEISYNEQMGDAANYDMTTRIASVSKIMNIPEILMGLRLYNEPVFKEQINTHEELEDIIRVKQINNFKLKLNEEEEKIYLKLIKRILIPFENKPKTLSIIDKLLMANQQTGYYNQERLEDFFSGLLSSQLFFIETLKSPLSFFRKNTNSEKFDLKDVTFIIPVRVESAARLRNLETVVSLINRDFETTIFIIEADTHPRYISEKSYSVYYQFVCDEDTIFHHTRYRNQMLRMAKTPYAAVWDTDAIANPESIIDATEQLRTNQAVMVFPYDGRYYKADCILTNIFHQTQNYNFLLKNIPQMNLMYGYHAVGGAFLVNREQYLVAGGENENIYGWGPEDSERVKRMEVLNLPVYRSKEPLFHLWHPRGMNSWYADKENEIKSRKEFLKTCQLSLL